MSRRHQGIALTWHPSAPTTWHVPFMHCDKSSHTAIGEDPQGWPFAMTVAQTLAGHWLACRQIDVLVGACCPSATHVGAAHVPIVQSPPRQASPNWQESKRVSQECPTGKGGVHVSPVLGEQ